MKKLIKLIIVNLIISVSISCSDDSSDVARYNDLLPPDINKGFYLSTALWPSDPLSGVTNISVCWENPSEENATERGWVRDAVENSWGAANSRLRFTNWGSCGTTGADIHIRVLDGVCEICDSLAPHTHGLGTKIDGKYAGMNLNFTFQNWGCCTDRDDDGNCTAYEACDDQSYYDRESWIHIIATHEFGHALGIAHEHNRNDTPDWCNASQGSNGDTAVGDWDNESVMNYCNPIWNNNGILSDGDTATITQMYPVRIFNTPCDMGIGVQCCE